MAIEAFRPPLRGTKHMAVAGHYLASLAAYEILEAGGTAADAGVAAIINLAVVQSDLVNVAGVAPTMILDPSNDEVVTIDGLGIWPAAADVDYFRNECDGLIPPGVRRSIVPGAPSAWIAALKRFGRMSFADVARAAIGHAREGFVMYPNMAELVAKNRDAYAQWPSSAAIYLPAGAPPQVGDVFRQTDLAATLQYMADQEAASGGDREAGLQAAHDAFYRGDIARKIADFQRDEGGWLAYDDLAGFQARFEPPVSARYGDRTVFACGPWCQGPALLQTLNLLPPAEMARLADRPADWTHRIVEALKLAFADREAHYGDPRFVDVPLDRLLSETYAAEQRRRIDPARAAGAPDPAPAAVALPRDTSYACVVDSDGMVFSATPSDTSHDTPVTPGTGLAVSSRGNQSWTTPGHPAVMAPGKRPRLTPNPAIAVGPDGWRLPFGTPGGDVQIQAMVQCFLNVVIRGDNVQSAVERPRFATYSFPDSFDPHLSRDGLLKLERRMPKEVGRDLAARGHGVDWFDDWDRLAGSICMIEADPAKGTLTGGADPRRTGYAAGR